MRIFSETTNRKAISILQQIPSRVEYRPGKPAISHFANGDICSIGCIGCTNPKCMRFEPQDITCDEVKNFPNDQSLDVCPVDAMRWDYETDAPIIDGDKCINCGICINRCPVGAIYFDRVVKVNIAQAANVDRKVADKSTVTMHFEQIASLEKIQKTGTPILESDKLFDSIYSKLSNIRSNYHNLIARNLLIALRCRSAMRRIGDVYTRMDAVYSSPDNCFGAVEVEFGRDTLDASRGVLDDIAVLYTRYGIHKSDNMPLVVCLQLPNARQGYWQVVKDIKTVEDITISTITVGAMMLLVWNGYYLMPDDVTYYLDYDNMDLRSAISHQLYRSINLSDKHLGILEPMK